MSDNAEKDGRPGTEAWRGKLAEHLDRSILLEETGVPAAARLAVVSGAAFVLAFLAWAALMRLDEVSVAPGAVLPREREQPVAHPEGGVVARVSVAQGQRVERDQELLALDDTALRSELRELEAQTAAAGAEAGRMRALASGNAAVPPAAAGDALGLALESLAMGTAALEEQAEALKAAQREMEERVKQKERDLALLARGRAAFAAGSDLSLEKLARERELLEKEIGMRRDLVDLGLHSRIQFLALERQQASLERQAADAGREAGERRAAFEREEEALKGELASLPLLVAGKRREVAERERRVAELRAETRKTAMEAALRAEERRAVLLEKAERQRERIARTRVVSPIAGVVQELLVPAAGAVVGSGAPLARIVPDSGPLVAEVRISTRDIGHVKKGQAVRLKFDNYDYARYGLVEATLDDISPSTVAAGGAEPYFRGEVRLASAFLRPERREHPLQSGMTLKADIVTGRKTVLQYLLKPVYASAQEAFRER